MSNETSKGYLRRLAAGYFDRYLRGNGIDIGCGNDILQITNGTVFPYDKLHQDPDHEAQTMNGIGNRIFDFAYSSNCLEHVYDPVATLHSWIRIVKPGGIVFFTVPDEELYEHKCWPSKFHKGHLWSFTMKKGSELPKSIYLPDWLKQFGVEIISIHIADSGYNYYVRGIDQTKTGAEAFIEVILRTKEHNNDLC